MGPNYKNATLKQLFNIRYYDDGATMEQKIGVETEILRRQRKPLSGKLDKHPRSKR